MIDPIRIEGLAEFNRALRRMDSELPKGLRLAGNRAATVVVDWAVPRIPRRTGRAARSVKARSTRTATRVASGGTRAPHMPWLDFGGQGRIKGKPAKRPFIKEGRYVWAGYVANRAEVERVLQESLLEVARGAGVEVD